MWSKLCQLSLPLHWCLHSPGVSWEDPDFRGPHSPEGGPGFPWGQWCCLTLSLSLVVSDLP